MTADVNEFVSKMLVIWMVVSEQFGSRDELMSESGVSLKDTSAAYA